MQYNPHVEICATIGNEFLRYYGTAIFEADDTIATKALAAMPGLQKIYNDETGYHLAIFYIKNATVEFRTMMDIKESYHFD